MRAFLECLAFSFHPRVHFLVWFCSRNFNTLRYFIFIGEITYKTFRPSKNVCSSLQFISARYLKHSRNNQMGIGDEPPSGSSVKISNNIKIVSWKSCDEKFSIKNQFAVENTHTFSYLRDRTGHYWENFKPMHLRPIKHSSERKKFQ